VISGPGNRYVTEAKRQVAGFVGIDGMAGPSELAIVADGDVDPRMAALDLIAQAEHDPEARTFFVTPDAALAEKVDAALEQELAHVGRREIVDLAIRHTKLVLVRDLQHAAAAVNDVAAEHLLLDTFVTAAAINLIRLDAWWTGKPLDRTRTTHLQRLTLSPAA